MLVADSSFLLRKTTSRDLLVLMLAHYWEEGAGSPHSRK